MKKGKISVWVLLFPLYIAFLIPLYKWTKKIYSPDLNLSKEELNVFDGEGKIKKDSKYIEPDLEDVAFILNYKNQGSSVDEEDPYKKIANMTKEEKNIKSKSKEEKKYKKKDTSERENEYIKQVDQAKEGQMMSVGYKEGFLTKTVGNLMDNPSAVKKIFNNSFVVKGFMSRGIVKNNLSNQKALENYLTKSNAVKNFLNNSIVEKVLNNPKVMGAIVSTSLASEILKSPAVQGLLNDPNKMNEIISSNPDIAKLFQNPNIMQNIMSNPDTSKAFMNLQMNK